MNWEKQHKEEKEVSVQQENKTIHNKKKHFILNIKNYILCLFNMKLNDIFSWKTLSNEDNKTKIIGLLSILIVLWVILYFIPSIFALIFNTFLGNIILFIIVLLVTLNDIKKGIILGLIFIVLIRFASLSNTFTNSSPNNINEKIKEGFELSQDSITKFLYLQQTLNPKVVFDIDMLKQGVTQSELDYFLQNKQWPWSDEVTKLYIYQLNKNPYIQMYPEVSLNKVKTIYYQTAILKLLSTQTKEAQFLINGVDITNTNFQNREGAGSYAYNSGQISPIVSGQGYIIKCGLNNQSQQYELQRVKYTGNDGILGYHSEDIQNISFNSLPDMIPGFKFTKGNCDPCVALNNPPSYTCPFNLEVKDRPKGISPIWQYLWNINKDPLKSEPTLFEAELTSSSSMVSSNTSSGQNKATEKDFPLFKQIKPELNKIYVKTGISMKE